MTRRLGSIPAAVATASILWSTVTLAQDRYCDALHSHILPNHLYAASCASPRCLIDLTGRRDAALRKGAYYRFLLGLGGDLPTQSVVIIKAKYWNKEVAKNPQMKSVYVRREEVPFGCNPITGRSRVEPAYPADGEASVSFQGYDNYHRLGFAGVDDRRKLQRFHFSYRSDKGCRATARASNQFLLHMPNYQPGFFAAAAIRSGLSTSYAFAADDEMYQSITRYGRIAVRLGSYQRSNRITACVSVDVRTDFDRLDIEFIDLERILPLGTSLSWKIPFN